jgi:hypothetical protein
VVHTRPEKDDYDCNGMALIGKAEHLQPSAVPIIADAGYRGHNAPSDDKFDVLIWNFNPFMAVSPEGIYALPPLLRRNANE